MRGGGLHYEWCPVIHCMYIVHVTTCKQTDRYTDRAKHIHKSLTSQDRLQRLYQGCTPRPAPPRAKMAAQARPDPEKFQHCPAPPRKKIVLPRPENIDRMFRGKVRGKCSYITKRFCESKTFEQYFLAPKVLVVPLKGKFCTAHSCHHLSPQNTSKLQLWNQNASQRT